MILRLSESEVTTLLLHMSITRKNIRNGFKRNYGRDKSKEILASFDEIKNDLEAIVEKMDEDKCETGVTHELHYNINEIVMFDSFLSWYIGRLKKTLDDASRQARKDINEEDKGQLDAMKSVKIKVDRLKDMHDIA